jgi:hypothetical protein
MDDILDTSYDVTVDYVKSYLSGIEYALDLDDVIKIANMQRAPNNVINVLNNMPNRVYDNAEELDFYLDKTIRSM